MAVMAGTARKARREWTRMGRPWSSRNCLETPPVLWAMRVPIPAAGMMTNTDMGIEV